MFNYTQFLIDLNSVITNINNNLDNQCDSLKILQDNITKLQYNLDNLLLLVDEKKSILSNIDELKKYV